ncbi:Fic family protein [Nanoarchaeota archaeon]
MFVEKQKRGKKTYFYLVNNIRKGNKVTKERVYLGGDLSKKELEEKIEEAKSQLDPLFSILNKEELEEINEIKDELNKIISTIPKENFYEHFIVEFTYDSNAIEGSTLTLDETRQVIFEGMSPKKPLRNVKEALNHKEAFDFMESHKDKINSEFICELQEIVVKNTLPTHLSIFGGTLRGVNVRVGNHIAPNFDKVPKLLKELLRWHANYKKKINPLVLAAHFHCAFEDIHPFVDGNGRAGRLLLNLMLKNEGYPYLNITVKDRIKYYKALDDFHKTKSCRKMTLLLKKIYMSTLRKYKRSL